MDKIQGIRTICQISKEDYEFRKDSYEQAEDIKKNFNAVGRFTGRCNLLLYYFAVPDSCDGVFVPFS